MTFDRQRTGLLVLRVLLGAFFLFQGLSKVRWFVDGSMLASQLTAWQQAASAGSMSARYLQQFALPHVALLARLVPAGEIVCGLGIVVGLWTSLFAFVAFAMVMNYHIASGALFHYGFLTNALGLPVLGGMLALALGGVKLPWSLR